MRRRIEMKVYRIVTGTSLESMTWNNTEKYFLKRPAVFVFLGHTQDFFRWQSVAQPGGWGLSPV